MVRYSKEFPKESLLTQINFRQSQENFFIKSGVNEIEERTDFNSTLENEWVIKEILKFESPILAIEKGDIFGIGKNILVVLTINSIHIIGSEIAEK